MRFKKNVIGLIGYIIRVKFIFFITLKIVTILSHGDLPPTAKPGASQAVLGSKTAVNRDRVISETMKD